MDSGDAKVANNITPDILQISQIKEDIAGVNMKFIENPTESFPTLPHRHPVVEEEDPADYPTLPPRSLPSRLPEQEQQQQQKSDDVHIVSSVEELSLLNSSDAQDSKGCWPYSSGGGESSGKPPVVMPVHMDSEIYNMNHPKRGRAIIFNHENFNPQLELSKRQGTEKDKQNLKQTLKALGFEVTHFDDLTYHELLHQIEGLTKEDHQDRDCLLIAILSHGDAQLMYAKDYSYKPDMLWSSFTADRVPTLAGKPKLFFIQACQGSQLDDGTRLQRVSRTEVDSQPASYRIPNHADFLIAYSTFPGHYAWRNTTNGSWFIQAICSVLSKYACKKDLLAMMTIVCREVALHYESNTPSIPHMHQKKQCPFITSTLTRDIYIVPK